ncbi:MAG: metallophosphoesterase [Erysipelotrichaceae bacterium]
MKVKYLEVDDDVNVFVVGDIHASYTLLKETLKEVGFNYNKDLLIAVGDLVC